MAKFSDEHKEEKSSNYFGPGVHKVQIMEVNFDTDDQKREFAEFTVVDPENDDRHDKARLWFTTDKAIGFSFSTIRNIFVHNAPDDKKDAVRERFNALKDTKELEEACQKTLIGKECWFTVYENPERTYTNSAGELKNSYDRNIYGYEPKPRVETTSQEANGPAPKADDNSKGLKDEGGDQPFGF